MSGLLINFCVLRDKWTASHNETNDTHQKKQLKLYVAHQQKKVFYSAIRQLQSHLIKFIFYINNLKDFTFSFFI